MGKWTITNLNTKGLRNTIKSLKSRKFYLKHTNDGDCFLLTH